MLWIVFCDGEFVVCGGKFARGSWFVMASVCAGGLWVLGWDFVSRGWCGGLLVEL